MPKARKLTEVEEFYIQNNPEKTDSQIASMMSGVGEKTVSKYRSELPEKDTGSVTETRKERMERLASGPKSGDLITQRDGSTIMTQSASEVSDARKTVMGNSATEQQVESKNRNQIHRPKS